MCHSFVIPLICRELRLRVQCENCQLAHLLVRLKGVDRMCVIAAFCPQGFISYLPGCGSVSEGMQRPFVEANLGMSTLGRATAETWR